MEKYFTCKIKKTIFTGKMQPLSDQQRLFLVESDQLYREWREVLWRNHGYKYGMRWKNVHGKDYLLRLTSASGNSKSLGPRTPQTELIYEQFVQGKELTNEKYQGLKAKIEAQRKLNRAVRLGRLPSIIGDILLALDRSQALAELRVVGTHAIFAYESMAAVELKMELLASGDIDLLFDVRKQISLIAKKLDGEGLLGLLKKVDKTFEISTTQGFRAINKDGFMVDLIGQDKGIMASKPIPIVEGDLEIMEIPNLEWLANAPRIEQVVIAANGAPVMMPVADPRAFAIHKAWLSHQLDREPVKKQRDLNQAIMVLNLIRDYLPHLPMPSKEMRYFPKKIIKKSLEDLQTSFK
jgi:hypothetical protein